MRLICPNCGAQYEIDSALLPEAGRDVQCSACGHTWFQRFETLEDELADEGGVTEAVEPAAVAPDLEEPAEAEPEPEAETADMRGRKPDEAALAILREEAEREAEARRRDAQGLETQGDLGLSGAAPGRVAAALDDDAPTAAAAAAVIAASVEADPSAGLGKGSNVFPDIDEINSSLSVAESEAVAARDAEMAEETKKSSRLGFRIGFLTVVVFIAVLIVLYAFAPRLADIFPGLRPALADYVSWANARRDQVEGLMEAATSVLGGE